MSILRNLINSVIASSSNEGFERVRAHELASQIKEAIQQTTEDGSITADELDDISKLTDKLSLRPDEFDYIKLNVLEHVVDHILADGEIREDEMNLFKRVEDSINVAPEDRSEELKAKVARVKSLVK